MASISENYGALQDTRDNAREAARDTESRARIAGVAEQMEKLELMFGVELSRKLLSMVDNLSRSLRSKKIQNVGQQLASQTLQQIRSDECFDLFWKYVDKRQSSPEVSAPSLPRKRKVPHRF